VPPVMDSDAIGRALRRIAHEVVEHNKGVADVMVLGIHTRGAPLAMRLGKFLTEIEGAPVSVGTLDIGKYRDDIDARPTTPLGHTEIPDPLDGQTIVLVDDVLFTGRTIRAALGALADLGRPGKVQLAVLVDRGHRELPIRADYVGKNLPTSRRERVAVRLTETDGTEGVFLESVEPTGQGALA
jgi:pyrimidine operon attenuation protein/uracil phosphoribosyltransferase